jgi:hypothetical protein
MIRRTNLFNVHIFESVLIVAARSNSGDLTRFVMIVGGSHTE